MRNLKPYQDAYFELHKEAVNAKNDSELVKRLNDLEQIVETRYNEFLKHFESNTLESVSDSTLNKAQKEDLKSLYDYQFLVIRKLKKNIDRNQIMAIRGTCQNCTINPVNSFDHYLPKSQYSEYSVNPINLFPSCRECNGHKSSNWKATGGRIFLNLYLDELPSVRYLKVTIDRDEYNDIVASFELDLSLVNGRMKQMLENQYFKLNLLERMKIASNAVIASLSNSLIQYSKKLSLEENVSTAIEHAKSDLSVFGENYWKSLLQIELVNNDSFLEGIGIKPPSC